MHIKILSSKDYISQHTHTCLAVIITVMGIQSLACARCILGRISVHDLVRTTRDVPQVVRVGRGAAASVYRRPRRHFVVAPVERVDVVASAMTIPDQLHQSTLPLHNNST